MFDEIGGSLGYPSANHRTLGTPIDALPSVIKLVMKLLDRVRSFSKWFVTPQTTYRIGDAVRLRGRGNDMMVVIEILSSRGMDEPLLHCHLSNADSKCESEVFPESAIEPFDWTLHRGIRRMDT